MIARLFRYLMICLLTLLSSVSAQSNCDDPCEDVADERFGYYWDGAYVGAQLGWGWTDLHAKFSNSNYFNTLGPIRLGSDFSFHRSKFIGGGIVGYNHQIGPYIVGVEGGVLYLNGRRGQASPFFPTTDRFIYSLQWLSNAKLRFGYDYNRLLTFVSAGWAGGGVDLSLQDFANNVYAHTKRWANGWTVGLGAEYKYSCHLSFGLAYDYAQLSYRNSGLSCSNCGIGVGLGSPLVRHRVDVHAVTFRFNFFLGDVTCARECDDEDS